MNTLLITATLTLIAFSPRAIADAKPGKDEGPGCQATDLPGIIGCYSPQKPNWHEYTVASTELCNQAKNPKCTKEKVREIFLRNVMPCQDSSIIVTHGARLRPKAPTPLGCTHEPGTVITHVHEEGVVTVSIRTHTDHELHDGVVLRYLQEKSPGVFSVFTRGIGNNRSYFWKMTNKEIGPIIFWGQNKRLKAAVEQAIR